MQDSVIGEGIIISVKEDVDKNTSLIQESHRLVVPELQQFIQSIESDFHEGEVDESGWRAIVYDPTKATAEQVQQMGVQHSDIVPVTEDSRGNLRQFIDPDLYHDPEHDAEITVFNVDDQGKRQVHIDVQNRLVRRRYTLELQNTDSQVSTMNIHEITVDGIPYFDSTDAEINSSLPNGNVQVTGVNESFHDEALRIASMDLTNGLVPIMKALANNMYHMRVFGLAGIRGPVRPRYIVANQ